MSKHVGDKLIDYAWGMLAPQEQASAEAHLRECQACRAELAQHRAITSKLAQTVPAMLPDAPPNVRGGWAQVAARVPHLRPRPSRAPNRQSLHGFAGAGLAIAAAVLLFVVMTTGALLGLGRPPLTVTAYSTRPSATPIASAMYTPERPAAVATPVVFLYTPPLQAPRPAAVTTARP